MQFERGRTNAPAAPAGASATTGEVLLDKLLEADGVNVNAAVFMPCARTFWHTHERGQLFFITSGKGVIATRDGRVQVVLAGDVIHTPPGEEHWHGAAPDCFVSYNVVSLGRTEFSDAVTDEEYASATEGSRGP